jgi:peptidoglycan/xylan/chitin deacetylase (PgdA/CDA1 family)
MTFPFRFDRAVSVRLAHPISTRRKRTTAGRVPILMYHGINPEVGSQHPYFETNTSPAAFRAHMNILARNDYTTLDLEGALNAIQSAGDSNRKAVITFDDGYYDFYNTAFPILVENGFQATLFIVTSLTGAQRVSRNGKEYMTWGEVREVHARGIRIGSHTVGHGKLWNMTPTQIDDELRGSKEAIEDKLGTAVQSFAYPYAFPAQDKRFIQFLRDRLQRHGYGNGVSTTIGTAKGEVDRYFLPRLPVNTFDDETFFRAKLEGGYEWLRVFQQAKKALQTRPS